jgi:tetratricopeptide (TPR) repeat protein
MFRHALTQEVAYKTLLLPARKLLHQSVGRAMEEIFAERIEEFTGLLAFHYFSGEAWEEALDYSTRAADYTSALYAYAESREHYRRALESLKHLPDSEANRRTKVALILSLVNVSLQAVAPEQNLALLTEAEKIARQLQDRLAVARVQLWIGRIHYLAGKTREAIGYFQQVLPIASESNDPELLSLPGAVIGRALFIQGHFAKSQQLLEQAVPLLEAAKNHRELLFAYIYRGGARTALGDFTAGSADITNALKMARASRNQNAETMAQTGFAVIKLIAGRYAEAMVHAREALLVAEKTGDAMFRYASNGFMAWGLTGIGDHTKALTHWAAAHEAAKPLGGQLLLGDWLAAMESETYLEKGDLAAAIEKSGKAVEIAKATGSVIAEGLAERILGRAYAGQSRWPEAEGHLAKSAALLETIDAKFDLARTALHQGKLAIQRDNKEAAAEFLERAAALAASCGLQREEGAARSLIAGLQPPA